MNFPENGPGGGPGGVPRGARGGHTAHYPGTITPHHRPSDRLDHR